MDWLLRANPSDSFFYFHYPYYEVLPHPSKLRLDNMTSKDHNFFMGILDERGFPDIRIIQQMRENKEPVPESGTYKFTGFVSAGYHIYGMNRPIRLIAHRKLSSGALTFTITDDAITYETYYSLNNSDVDPYLIRVTAKVTIDHAVLELVGPQNLIVGRYERSFVRAPFEEGYGEQWVTCLELRITKRESSDRYPYSLKRTLSLIYNNIYQREIRLESDPNCSEVLGIVKRLPTLEEVEAISPTTSTPVETGELFYKALSGKYYSPQELIEMADQVTASYRGAMAQIGKK